MTFSGSKMICAASASEGGNPSVNFFLSFFILVRGRKGGETRRTPGFTTAHSTVRRVAQVAAYVADFGVEQALAGKVAPVQVLRAPEAPGRDGAALRALGDGARGRRGGFWRDGESCGLGEGAREPGDEGWEG